MNSIGESRKKNKSVMYRYSKNKDQVRKLIISADSINGTIALAILKGGCL